MNIGSICKREIVFVDRGQTLQHAAALMREYHVGALVVTQDAAEGKQVAGIVTDRDLVVEAMARGLDNTRAPVREITSDRLVLVPASASLDEAIARMQSDGVRRLLVTTDEGALFGVVAFDDVLDAVATELAGLANTIRNGIARENVERSTLPPQEPASVRVPNLDQLRKWSTSLPV